MDQRIIREENHFCKKDFIVSTVYSSREKRMRPIGGGGDQYSALFTVRKQLHKSPINQTAVGAAASVGGLEDDQCVRCSY